jgi:hypothetical protein
MLSKTVSPQEYFVNICVVSGMIKLKWGGDVILSDNEKNELNLILEHKLLMLLNYESLCGYLRKNVALYTDVGVISSDIEILSDHELETEAQAIIDDENLMFDGTPAKRRKLSMTLSYNDPVSLSLQDSSSMPEILNVSDLKTDVLRALMIYMTGNLGHILHDEEFSSKAAFNLESLRKSFNYASNVSLFLSKCFLLHARSNTDPLYTKQFNLGKYFESLCYWRNVIPVAGVANKYQKIIQSQHADYSPFDIKAIEKFCDEQHIVDVEGMKYLVYVHYYTRLLTHCTVKDKAYKPFCKKDRVSALETLSWPRVVSVN